MVNLEVYRRAAANQPSPHRTGQGEGAALAIFAKKRDAAKSRPKAKRGGAALLLCIFVMAVTTVMTAAILDAEMLDMTVLRNTVDYERANYLAGAAVNHALAELEVNAAWRTGIPSTEFPAGSGYIYSATAIDGSGGAVVVTGTGNAGGITRKLQVTVQAGT